MTYNERLHKYEQEKAKLQLQNLTEKEYELAIRKLANKWKI